MHHGCPTLPLACVLTYVMLYYAGPLGCILGVNIAVRGESGVAGEGRVVGIPKFHSWDKCTMGLTNINSD